MKTIFQRMLLLTVFLAAMLFQGLVVAQTCDNLLVNPIGLQPVTTGWNVLQVSGNSPGFGQFSGTGFISTYGGCGSLRWNRKAQTIDLVALGFDPAWLDNAPSLSVEETFRTVVDNAFCTYPSGNALDLYFLKVELRDASHNVIASINWGSTSTPLFAPYAGVTHAHTFSGYASGLRYIYFEDGAMDAGWWGGFYGTYMEHPRVKFDEDMIPVITCPDNIQVDADAGVCSAVVEYVVNFSDDCAGATLSQINGIPSGNPFPLGTTTNTFKVTDSSGNTAQCSFTVNVEDNELPTITCPDPITVVALPGSCEARVCYPSPVASDNCDPATPAGYQFLSTLGNSYYYKALSTTSFLIARTNARAAGGHLAVITSAAENAVMPSITAWLGGSDEITEGQWLWETCEPFVFSNWSPGEPNNSGSIEHYLLVQSNKLWNDGTNSGILFPGILEVEGARFVQTTGLGQNAIFPKGVTTNTFVVTDAAGNNAECVFTVTVVDEESPTISCPNDIIVDNDPGSCSAVVEYNITVNDNCDVPELILQEGAVSGSAFNVGVTPITWVAFDAAGNNAECSFSITVHDNENPEITCPDDIEVNNDPGICGAVVTYTVEFDDNCPGATLNQSEGIASGGNFPVGTTTNEFIVSDAAGNTAPCSFTVNVEDNEPPSIICPNNIEVSNDPGNCGAVVAFEVAFNDNCPGASLAQSEGLASGEIFPVGLTTNTFAATDAQGFITECAFTVKVNDTEPPVALCQDITVNPDGGGNYNFSASNVDAGSYDNCGVDNISLHITWLSCYEASEAIVILTVEDIHGNTASCTAIVTPTGDSDCDGVGNACDVCPGGDDSVDNNNDGLPDCRYPPSYNQIIADWKCGNNKVYVCQIPPGNPNAKKTICVSYNALNAHMNNGSYLGPCGNASCQQPIAPKISGNGGINGGLTNPAEIIIYPNPAQDVVYIQFAEKEMPSQLTIYDQLGRLVWSETIAPGQVVTQLNLYQGRFSDGMYVVQMLSEDGLQSKKMVISR